MYKKTTVCLVMQTDKSSITEVIKNRDLLLLIGENYWLKQFLLLEFFVVRWVEIIMGNNLNVNAWSEA